MQDCVSCLTEKFKNCLFGLPHNLPLLQVFCTGCQKTQSSVCNPSSVLKDANSCPEHLSVTAKRKGEETKEIHDVEEVVVPHLDFGLCKWAVLIQSTGSLHTLHVSPPLRTDYVICEPSARRKCIAPCSKRIKNFKPAIPKH